MLVKPITLCIFMCVHPLIVSVQVNSADEYMQTPAFEPIEQFLDIFPLTKENFTDFVLKNKDPWVILFHAGSLARQWKTMAVSLRGVVWVGMVDTREETELLESIRYTPNHDPESRVYPQGPMSIKKKQWKNAKNPNEARLIATDSITDMSIKLKGRDLQDFLLDCYSSVPSRFPIILLTDEMTTPVPYRALSNRFGKYFNFGRMMNPTLEDYKSLGMQDYFLETPILFVLIAEMKKDSHRNTDASTGEMEFSAIQFNEKKHGAMNYPNVMKFLFAINYGHRYRLLGENKSNEKDIAEMKDIIEIEKKRFDVKEYSKNNSREATDPPKQENTDFNLKKSTIDTHQSTKDEL